MGKDKNFKTMIGGQALIEGVMMMGPDKIAMVVRGPEGLVTQQKKLESIKNKHPILGWPIIRGVVNFVRSMSTGMKALMWSAEFFPEGEDEETPGKEPSRFSKWLDNKLSSEKAQKTAMTISMVFGIVLALGVFMLLPAFLTGLIGGALAKGSIVRNLLEGAVRLAILVGYLLLVSRMKDIQRVFSYHGAEHKTIACYEAGQELTVDNVRSFPRLHPRCGTSFLFTVVIISILVFSLMVPFDNMALRVVSRLVLLPVVVALSYEVNRLVGRYDNWLTRILRVPGLMMQKLTTNEPDDSMIEVGIESLKLALPDEQGADEWGRNN